MLVKWNTQQEVSTLFVQTKGGVFMFTYRDVRESLSFQEITFTSLCPEQQEISWYYSRELYILRVGWYGGAHISWSAILLAICPRPNYRWIVRAARVYVSRVFRDRNLRSFASRLAKNPTIIGSRWSGGPKETESWTIFVCCWLHVIGGSLAVKHSHRTDSLGVDCASRDRPRKSQ